MVIEMLFLFTCEICLYIPLKCSGKIVSCTDRMCLSGQPIGREPLLESEDGHFSTLCSVPGSQNIQSDSIVSFVASGEAQIDGGKNDSKYALSSSYCDNKSAYSSPVGLF